MLDCRKLAILPYFSSPSLYFHNAPDGHHLSWRNARNSHRLSWRTARDGHHTPPGLMQAEHPSARFLLRDSPHFPKYVRRCCSYENFLSSVYGTTIADLWWSEI